MKWIAVRGQPEIALCLVSWHMSKHVQSLACLYAYEPNKSWHKSAARCNDILCILHHGQQVMSFALRMKL